MADSRTFTLIGEFQDNITSELDKINSSLNTFKRNMMMMTSRRGGGFSDVTTAVGKLVSAQKHLKTSIEEVGAAARSATSDLKDYKNVVGKVARAHFAINKSTNTTGQRLQKQWEGASQGVVDYKRQLQTLGRLERTNRQNTNRIAGGGMGGGAMPPSPRPPRFSSSGAGGNGPRPPRPSGGGGGYGGGGMSAHMAEFGFAYTLGSGIAQPIQTAIISGFQIGIGLMTKPFEYFAQNFGERVQDEMTDLKAAAGFFSILKDRKGGFIQTFQDAIDFTQENNLILDRMAATLPGSTQDFIEVGKRISDSVARLVNNDTQKSIAYAEQLRKADPTNLDPLNSGAIKGTGSEAQKRAIQTILADLTKDTVLAGQGGGGGPQGAMGAYGLPQLTERLLSQQDVSIGQFQKYAAIFKDPMILTALQKEMPKIQNSAASTVERAKAIKQLFEKVLPPELIERYRRTMAGVTEGFNTAIFGKESGLFGLGRKMAGLGEQFDEYGYVVKDASGKVKQAKLSLYDFARDILVNLGQVFQPIAENITKIYDPLRAVAEKLVDARKFTFKLLSSFDYYMGGFEDLGFEGGEKNLRASLATIANLLRYIGAIGEGDFTGIVNQLKGKKIDFASMMKGMVDKLLNSDAATKVGETIGSVVGTVFNEVSKVTGFISGRLKESNNLFAGLKAGFNAAGGTEAFRNIFKDLFKSLFNVLIKVATIIPVEAYMVMAAMVVIPAAIQGLGMLFAERLLGGILGLNNVVNKSFDNADFFARRKAIYNLNKAKAKGGFKPLAAQTRTGAIASHSRSLAAKRMVNPQFPQTALGTHKPMSLGGSYRAPSVPKGAGAKGVPVTIQSFAKNALKGTGNFLKGIPGAMGGGGRVGLKDPIGMLGRFGTALTGLVGIINGIQTALSGGSIWDVLGATAGPIIGTIIGTALLGPIGGIIGGMIGSIESVTQPLGAAFESIFGTLSTTFELIIQIGTDLGGVINGLVRKIPGVSKSFDVLRFLITALVSPFRLLELMIMGLYEGYLRIKEKFFGLSDDEKRKKNELFQQRMEKTASLELDFKQAYNKKARAEYQKELDLLRAKGKGGEERARIVESALKQIDEKLKASSKPTASKPGTPATSKSGGVDAALRALGGDPNKPLNIPKLTSNIPATSKLGGVNAALAALGGDPNKPLNIPRLTSNTPSTAPTTNAAASVTTAQATTATATTLAQVNQKTAVNVAKQTQTNTTLGVIKSVMGTLGGKLDAMTAAIRAGNMAVIAAINDAASKGGFGGMGGGGIFNLPTGDGVGKVVSAGKMLQGMGLNVAENPYFGTGKVGGHAPGSYHYAGRAIDVTGPPAVLDAAYAKLKTTNPAELLWRTAGHYDHLHVAYALGAGMPAFFGSQRAAMSWERSMVPGSVKVGSVTSNSSEGFGGGPITINAPITIHQQPGQDADDLAAIVAMKIGEAVSQARSASVFV
jgi:hypothetical protein